jgi:F-type H+-transporting ATPase subunit b
LQAFFKKQFKGLKDMLLTSSLATPAVGTIIWSIFIFILFVLLLAKFAWGPIMNAIKAREDMIRGSLDAAAKAREEMLVLQADNETILKAAREERDKILRDARIAYDKMMADARDKGIQEAEALVVRAKESIEREKNAALTEVKNEVANLAIEIASKVIGEKLKNDDEQQRLIQRYLKEVETNKN